MNEKIIKENVKKIFENHEDIKIKAYKLGKKAGREDLEDGSWIDSHTAGNVFEKMVQRALQKHDLIKKGMEREEKEEIGHAFAHGYLKAND